MTYLVTQLLLWVLLEFTGYSDLADCCEYLVFNTGVVMQYYGSKLTSYQSML